MSVICFNDDYNEVFLSLLVSIRPVVVVVVVVVVVFCCCFFLRGIDSY